MREIKFRAWDKKISKMFSWEVMNRNRIFALDSNLPNKDFLVVPNGENIELMQYTGLKDKNGKEIYEGDIVRILYTDWGSQHLGTPEQQAMTLEEYKKSISRIGYVIYAGDRYYLRFNGKYGEYDDGMYEGTHGEKEIIGNIYENPELLTTN